MKRILSFFLVLCLAIATPSSAFAIGTNNESNIPESEKRVSEVVDLREKNSETFLLSDGSYECVVYAEDKYYQNESGNLVEIDNSIVRTIYTQFDKEYRYKNAANSYCVYFTENSPSVFIAAEGRALSFSLIGTNKTQAIIGGKASEKVSLADYTLYGKNCVTYADIFTQTDIVYSADSSCLKEYIVLNSNDAPTKFTFSFDVSSYNYDIRQTAAGTIAFYDNNGDIAFELEKLFAVDAGGSYTDNLEYSVQESDDKTVSITISLSDDFAKDPDRVYPILIDPSVMVTGESSTYDTYVSSRYPTTSYYLNNYLRTGRDEDYYIRRTYIRFDLPSSISGKAITRAYINLKKSSGATPSIKAYRVTGSWSSSNLTWNNKPGYTTVNGSATATLTSNNWYRVYVTDIVKNWSNGTHSNYGFLIKDATESGTSQWTTFYSSDAASPNKPELVISYVNYIGSRAYQSAPQGGSSNCMGYALEYKQFIGAADLGFAASDLVGKTTSQMLSFIKGKAQTWMNTHIGSTNYALISAYDSDISTNWYRIVLRVGFTDADGDGRFDLGEEWDYHWWYQTNENNGQWAEKQGGNASRRIIDSNGIDPASYIWSGLYNSAGVYYQVKDIRTIGW